MAVASHHCVRCSSRILVAVGVAVALITRVAGDTGNVELLVDNIHVLGGAEDLRAAPAHPDLAAVHRLGRRRWAPRHRSCRRPARSARGSATAPAAMPHGRPDPHHHRHGGRVHRAVRRAARLGRVRPRDPASPRPGVLRGAAPRRDRVAVGLRRLRGAHRRGCRAGVAPSRRSAPLHGIDLLAAVAHRRGRCRSGRLVVRLPSRLLRRVLRPRPPLGRARCSAASPSGCSRCWSPYALTFGEAQLGGLLTTKLAVGALAVAVVGQAGRHHASRWPRAGRAASSSRCSSWGPRSDRSPTARAGPQRAGR